MRTFLPQISSGPRAACWRSGRGRRCGRRAACATWALSPTRYPHSPSSAHPGPCLSSIARLLPLGFFSFRCSCGCNSMVHWAAAVARRRRCAGAAARHGARGAAECARRPVAAPPPPCTRVRACSGRRECSRNVLNASGWRRPGRMRCAPWRGPWAVSVQYTCRVVKPRFPQWLFEYGAPSRCCEMFFVCCCLSHGMWWWRLGSMWRRVGLQQWLLSCEH